MLIEYFNLELCCFSQFLMYADSQVEGLVGHELLVLDFVLVAECQRIFAFILADELADNGYIAILVFLIKT